LKTGKVFIPQSSVYSQTIVDLPLILAIKAILVMIGPGIFGPVEMLVFGKI